MPWPSHGCGLGLGRGKGVGEVKGREAEREVGGGAITLSGLLLRGWEPPLNLAHLSWCPRGGEGGEAHSEAGDGGTPHPLPGLTPTPPPRAARSASTGRATM